ncbi:endonuclease/exonuclease/phosphatase family protein [Luteolibacter sp. LG18]|uniref:endonuclease/exonuclease/phosphatase family protein n=1 Tax=Luteolibacter sp. LG18 TaxID=2819286 RepID=UPI002B31D423|nr:hypothetical protein llg_42230 [Luteolibacter sp. LG18]
MRPLLCLLALATFSSASDLTVVSFNIRNGGRRMDGKYDHAFQQEILKKLKPDLVALQEVDHLTKRNGSVNVAATYAATLGMTSAYAAAMPYDGGAYGAAVLSKLPVVADESIHLPVKDGEPRVCVIRFVKTPDAGVIAIVGVHLDSGKDDTQRLENVRLIVQRLKAVKEPVIITGDFNDVPDSNVLKLFAEAGFRRVVPQGDPASFPADQPRVVIDHVLLRDGNGITIQDAGTTVVAEPNGSDHRPLLSHLRLLPAK